MALRATHASALTNTRHLLAARTSANRLQKYVRRGFTLEPLSVLRSTCFHEPARPRLRVCVLIDFPWADTHRIDQLAALLALFARREQAVGAFAVAIQKRTDRNILRFAKLLRPVFGGHGLAPPAHCDDADFITMWMEMKNGGGWASTGPKYAPGYHEDNLLTRANPSYGPDCVHVKGNHLAETFPGATGAHGESEGINWGRDVRVASKEQDISQSPSVVRLVHNETCMWLSRCLKWNAGPPAAYEQNTARADRILRDISVELEAWIDRQQPIYYPVGMHWAWPDNKLPLRHLRLALEDGCEHCTRDAKQGYTPTRNPHDVTAIDFSTCCLWWQRCAPAPHTGHAGRARAAAWHAQLRAHPHYPRAHRL